MNMDSDGFVARLDTMGAKATEYAQARAQRIYIEQFRKSKKAMLMIASEGRTIADREADAYSDPEYIELLEGLKAAVEVEEKCRWALERLKIDVEVWRTQQANERFARDRV